MLDKNDKAVQIIQEMMTGQFCFLFYARKLKYLVSLVYIQRVFHKTQKVLWNSKICSY